jgi:hypothetical protein
MEDVMKLIKVVVGLLVAGVAVGAFAVASFASDRTATLTVDKECPPSQYTGEPGSYCTFTSSNLKAAPAGSKVFYLQPEDLASDVVLDPPGPGNNEAYGRCELDEDLNGECTFDGGTGKFTHFQASFTVTYLGDDAWHWDGPYSFAPSR